MHEYSIVAALLEQVERIAAERGATAVHRLHVAIGELAGVEKDLLSTAYEAFRQRSVCAAAELRIRPVEARWRCPGCGRRPRRGEVLRCPDCRLPAKLDQGDEIILERIEMEVA